MVAAPVATPCPQILRAVGRRLQAGAAACDVTPSLGCSLAGAMRDRIADAVDDELLVRSLVLDNANTRLAIALVDSSAVPREIIDRAKRLITDHTQIPPDHAVVAATHTPSFPPEAHLFQSEPDPAYQDW